MKEFRKKKLKFSLFVCVGSVFTTFVCSSAWSYGRQAQNWYVGEPQYGGVSVCLHYPNYHAYQVIGEHRDYNKHKKTEKNLNGAPLISLTFKNLASYI